MNRNTDGGNNHYGKISIRKRVAYALAILGLPRVHRGTIRAMLPEGRRVKYRGTAADRRRENGNGLSFNVTSKKFGSAVWTLEQEENVVQREGDFIRVLDMDGLFEYALRGADGSTRNPAEFEWLVDIEAAVETLKAEIEAAEITGGLDEIVESRRRELIALQALMVGKRNDYWSGKGAVRFVPRGSAI